MMTTKFIILFEISICYEFKEKERYQLLLNQPEHWGCLCLI